MICPYHYVGKPLWLFAWHIDKHVNTFVKNTVIKLLLACFGYRIEMNIIIEKVK